MRKDVRQPEEQKSNMLAMARAVVRGVLAVVVFAVACPALAAISLVAMYSDRRLALEQAVE